MKLPYLPSSILSRSFLRFTSRPMVIQGTPKHLISESNGNEMALSSVDLCCCNSVNHGKLISLVSEPMVLGSVNSSRFPWWIHRSKTMGSNYSSYSRFRIQKSTLSSACLSRVDSPVGRSLQMLPFQRRIFPNQHAIDDIGFPGPVFSCQLMIAVWAPHPFLSINSCFFYMLVRVIQLSVPVSLHM